MQIAANLQYPEWQKLYQDALLELDRNKLRERVIAAEAAIYKRLGTMPSNCQNSAERQAIEDALANLYYLKRESRGTPDASESITDMKLRSHLL